MEKYFKSFFVQLSKRNWNQFILLYLLYIYSKENPYSAMLSYYMVEVIVVKVHDIVNKMTFNMHVEYRFLQVENWVCQRDTIMWT